MRKYLFAGLLVWLPLAITVGVLMWAIGLMDGMFHGILMGVQHVLPTSAENFLALLAGVPGLGVVAPPAGIVLPPVGADPNRVG